MTESPGEGTGPPQVLVELQESSGPLAPRYQHSTRIKVLRVGSEPRVAWELRDVQGLREDNRLLTELRLEKLNGILREALPPGTRLDLAAEFRDRKGISFNSVTVDWPEAPSRLDYLLSHLEEPGGNPTAQAVVRAIKELMTL